MSIGTKKGSSVVQYNPSSPVATSTPLSLNTPTSSSKKQLVLPLPEPRQFTLEKNVNLSSLSPSGFFNSGELSDNISLQDEFMGMLNQDEKLKQLAIESGVIENTIPQLSKYDQEQKQESKKRKISEVSISDTQTQPEKKKKITTVKIPATRSVNGDKTAKGLRHFSLKVCEKVEQKKITNYNQVASELVAESKELDESEQKNIRRRVYDALNVFIALGIISKEKKDIKWKGRPTTTHHEIVALERDKKILQESIAQKQKELDELCAQRDTYKKLISRNPDDPSINENSEETTRSRIYLPFIIVNTKNDMIECEVNDTRSAYFFSFRQPFEIHDDSEILKRMKF